MSERLGTHLARAMVMTPPTAETTTTNPPALTLARATLYQGGLMGWTTQRVRNLEITEGVRYAQYNAAVRVVYVPKGKRNKRRIMLTYDPQLLIVEGWDAPEFDARRMGPSTTGGGVTTSQSRHSACSSEWTTEFEAWLAEQSLEIAADYRGYQTKERR